MPTVSKECADCGTYYSGSVEDGEITCTECGNETLRLSTGEWLFDQCPWCENVQFYRRKDFNQLMGCLIILIGALLVPFTYGLSLPALLLVDWLLYRRVAEVTVCYKCGVEFRDFGVIPESVKVFDHHIAELYEGAASA